MAESVEDLRLLSAPGSSSGGARPEASVIDADGVLSIAKARKEHDDARAASWL